MSASNHIEPSFLEIKQCAVCESSEISKVLNNITDDVSAAVEYNGYVFICKSCDHAFLSPVLNKDTIHLAYKGYYTQSQDNLEISSNANFDKFSVFKEFYNYRFKGLKSNKGMFISFLSNIIPFVKFYLARASRFLSVPSENKLLTLLDVGCGRGDFLIRAKHCGYKATGIDFDPKTIEIANSRGLHALVGEIQDLPNSYKYDAITLSHVLEHVYDPKDLLKEILERLKPGGYLYLATPNFNSAGRLTFGKHWRGIDAPRHLHFFNTVSLEKLLNEIGYGSVKLVYDLPQSIGIIKSSFKLMPSGKENLLQSLRRFLLLLKHRFYHPNHLDVTVFRCFKSDVKR